MRDNAPHPTSAFAMGIRILVTLEAVVFVIATLLHAGIKVPVGFTEPKIILAAIVEGLIALFFAVSAYALLAEKAWARGWTIFATAFRRQAFCSGWQHWL